VDMAFFGRRDPWTCRLSAFFAVAGFPVVAGVAAVNGIPNHASFTTVAGVLGYIGILKNLSY